MRDMSNVSHDQAGKNGWKIVKPLNCEVVGKATFDGTCADGSGNSCGLEIMKSTKRFKVPGGWIYNTTTEIHKGSMVSCAEALAFVPDPE